MTVSIRIRSSILWLSFLGLKYTLLTVFVHFKLGPFLICLGDIIRSIRLLLSVIFSLFAAFICLYSHFSTLTFLLYVWVSGRLSRSIFHSIMIVSPFPHSVQIYGNKEDMPLFKFIATKLNSQFMVIVLG